MCRVRVCGGVAARIIAQGRARLRPVVPPRGVTETAAWVRIWSTPNERPSLREDNLSLKLSILDQSPIHESESASDALRRTIELAKRAEDWGFHRFWVAEHHGSSRVMGSSPEVLVSHLLAHTSRIRVGSGGVMLQHYSPYKVAENFNVLASLAPGRVDLGIGRGPGGLPRSTAALRRGGGEPALALEEKLDELRKFLRDELEPEHPLYGLQARPLPPQPPELFLLGTTRASGDVWLPGWGCRTYLRCS